MSDRATTLPSDPAERKKYPVGSGVLDYFPDAMVALAHLSYRGNEQHNPGQPLHWAREKSTDQNDTMIRHYLERGTRDTDGERHTAKMAWRALAMLQLEIEAEMAPDEAVPAPVPEGAGCCNDEGPIWMCERAKGHPGKHMAWDIFVGPNSPDNKLYEFGAWE